MRNKQYYESHRWRLSKGIAEIDRKKYLLQELRETQWNCTFEQLMRNRLVMGALRYGKINATNKPRYNRIQAIQDRLLQYEFFGNDEMLVDIANLAMLEFIEGIHPDKHFNSIDDGTHVTVIL